MSERIVRLLPAVFSIVVLAVSQSAFAGVTAADFDDLDDASYGSDYVYDENAPLPEPVPFPIRSKPVTPAPVVVHEAPVSHEPAPVCPNPQLRDPSPISAIRQIADHTNRPAPETHSEGPPARRPVASATPRPAPVAARPTSVASAGPTCALKKILAAAKSSVRSQWGNRPSSGGLCAKGVRMSLQASHVFEGSVAGGLGNAIDYTSTMKPHGFIDSGIRDVKDAPPGSIIVFSGPNTRSYLHGGGYGYPAGNWLGHVTIKGDDGYYYTDGRTREPAVGWSGGRNQRHVRNVAAVFVPGPRLAARYAGQCTENRLASAH